MTMLNEAEKDNLIELLGEKLHAEALKQQSQSIEGKKVVDG